MEPIGYSETSVNNFYWGADKSLSLPGRKQARKHVKDARDFNNIETRAVKFFVFFPARQGAEGGPGSSVGIETELQAGRSGDRIPVWARFFAQVQTVLGPTQPPVQWVPGLSRGKERPGHDADPSPLLVLWSRKSKAIPLLPLWAVRPVQSLSACTRVHLN